MKRLLIITLLFACFSISYSQQWINNFNHIIGGLKTGEDKAYAITVDNTSSLLLIFVVAKI